MLTQLFHLSKPILICNSWHKFDLSRSLSINEECDEILKNYKFEKFIVAIEFIKL
jgi:hypothetical protein